jgi:membrane protease YdiL (CAAX protease family)
VSTGERGGGANRTVERRWPVPRAIAAGLLVLVAGNVPPTALLLLNLRVSPRIPWCALLICGYLWLYWQYLGGRWWPRSTARSREMSRRTKALSLATWVWSAVAGGLAIAALTALTYSLAYLSPLGIGLPGLLKPVPPLGLLVLIPVVSAMAGIVEEAAFRGYMQGPIERRHGAAAAIGIVSLVFGLAHLNGWPVTGARLFLILLASIIYGILAHLTESILPGVVLHSAGDTVGFGLLYWASQRVPSLEVGQSALGVTSPIVAGCGLAALLLGASAVWAFRRLAAAATAERAPLTATGHGLGTNARDPSADDVR